MTDAVWILLHHPAINATSLQPMCPGCISFSLRWKNQLPELEPSAKQFTALEISVESLHGQNIVGAMSFHVATSLGAFIAYFGAPREIVSIVSYNGVAQILRYPEYGMSFSTTAPCQAEQNILKLTGTGYVLMAPELFEDRPDAIPWTGPFSPRLDWLVRKQACVP